MSTLLVDGNNVAMRAVHAMGRSDLAADGVPTGPLMVAINSLSRHIREEAPDRAVVVWDRGPSEFRTALYPAYKANRPAVPDFAFDETKRSTFGLIREFLALCGIHQIDRPGYEADDLIAYYCSVAPREEQVVILSSDKSETPILVSPQDAERVQTRTWQIRSDGYVQNGTSRGGRYVSTMLHRFIMGLEPGDPRSVDHHDGNPLNNRRANLRVTTHAQNQQNRAETKDWGSSSYRGVSWSKTRDKWIAYGYLDGHQHHLGYFEDEHEAGQVALDWRRENMPFADRQEPSPTKVVILSSDKDFLQLLDDGSSTGRAVEQVRLSSGGADTDRWTAARVVEEYGCQPTDLALAMALAGDTSDNVPGVPRFGMKTAIKHLAKAGWDLDKIEHPAVREHWGQVQTSLALVDLRTPPPGLDLPPLPPFETTGPTSVMYEDLLAFLARYRLDSVRTRLYAGDLWATRRGLATAPAAGQPV